MHGEVNAVAVSIWTLEVGEDRRSLRCFSSAGAHEVYQFNDFRLSEKKDVAVGSINTGQLPGDIECARRMLVFE